MLHVFLIHIDMSLGLAAADVLEIMITVSCSSLDYRDQTLLHSYLVIRWSIADFHLCLCQSGSW
jgi:hypothetical protein